MDERRRANRQKEIAVGGLETPRDDVVVDRLAEPDDARSCEAPAVGTGRWELRKRGDVVPPSSGRVGATVPAPKLPDRPVETNDVTGSGAFVKTVNVLRDDGEAPITPAPCGQHVVSRVGLARDNLLAAPVIPLLHECWVTTKGLRGSELFRSVGAPESTRTPECRNATRRGDTGVTDDGDSRLRFEPGGELIDGGLRGHGEL